MLQILLAVLAGILTIAAPCILPVLPILLGASVGRQSKTRPLMIVAGFIVTFSSLALLLSFLLQHTSLNPNILRNTAATVLAVFGLFMIFPMPFERLTQKLNPVINRVNVTSQKAGKNNWGGLVLGMTLGVIWTPCAGPILGSILTQIALQQDLIKSLILILAYSLGAGIPMLAIAYGSQALTTRVKRLARYSRPLQALFGVLILAMSILIFFGLDTQVQAYLVSTFPSFIPKY